MVILEVHRTNNVAFGSVVINSALEELKPFSEITISKSNGTQCQFRLTMTSSVPMGHVLIGEQDSRDHRLHLGHKYHVDGVASTLVVQNTPVIDFSQIKLAGCTSAIEQIVRRAFRPRKLPSDVRRKLGLQFVRGVILYGPPGTGKTSIIRELCKYFNLNPQVANGPQLLNSLIGRSEEAVRLLFNDAFTDQRTKGDSSPLHVVIFDEMDGLFAKRTPTDGGSGTRNGAVSQLSTIMDGYEPLNNILVFGTTSRLDMIDPTLFRFGRFDMQVRIDLPNVQERLEIFNFHFNEARKNGFLASDISTAHFQELANATDKYSGADIAGIVQSAITRATRRISIDTITDLEKPNSEQFCTRVEWNDLLTAFDQCERMR